MALYFLKANRFSTSITDN